MKYSEIAAKSVSELNSMLKEKEKNLFTLRQKLKTMQLQKPSEIRETKKDIARILTAINSAKKGAL